MKVCIQIRQDARGTYTAVCPGLPGCLGRGRTCSEAVIRIEDAIRGYVAALGNFVPESIDHELVEVPPGGETTKGA